MSSFRYKAVLLMGLAGAGSVSGQTPNEVPFLENYVGNVITITEGDRPPEKCVIRKVWRHPDGTYTVKAQSQLTSEMLTIERMGEVALKSGIVIPKAETKATVQASATMSPKGAVELAVAGGVAQSPPKDAVPPRLEKVPVTPAPALTPVEQFVGNAMTINEANRPPEKCVIRKVWRDSDGTYTVQAQSLKTGETLTIQRMTEIGLMNGMTPNGGNAAAATPVPQPMTAKVEMPQEMIPARREFASRPETVTKVELPQEMRPSPFAAKSDTGLKASVKLEPPTLRNPYAGASTGRTMKSEPASGPVLPASARETTQSTPAPIALPSSPSYGPYGRRKPHEPATPVEVKLEQVNTPAPNAGFANVKMPTGITQTPVATPMAASAPEVKDTASFGLFSKRKPAEPAATAKASGEAKERTLIKLPVPGLGAASDANKTADQKRTVFAPLSKSEPIKTSDVRQANMPAPPAFTRNEPAAHSKVELASASDQGPSAPADPFAPLSSPAKVVPSTDKAEARTPAPARLDPKTKNSFSAADPNRKTVVPPQSTVRPKPPALAEVATGAPRIEEKTKRPETEKKTVSATESGRRSVYGSRTRPPVLGETMASSKPEEKSTTTEKKPAPAQEPVKRAAHTAQPQPPTGTGSASTSKPEVKQAKASGEDVEKHQPAAADSASRAKPRPPKEWIRPRPVDWQDSAKARISTEPKSTAAAEKAKPDMSVTTFTLGKRDAAADSAKSSAAEKSSKPATSDQAFTALTGKTAKTSKTEVATIQLNKDTRDPAKPAVEVRELPKPPAEKGASTQVFTLKAGADSSAGAKGESASSTDWMPSKLASVPPADSQSKSGADATQKEKGSLAAKLRSSKDSRFTLAKTSEPVAPAPLPDPFAPMAAGLVVNADAKSEVKAQKPAIPAEETKVIAATHTMPPAPPFDPIAPSGMGLDSQPSMKTASTKPGLPPMIESKTATTAKTALPPVVESKHATESEAAMTSSGKPAAPKMPEATETAMEKPAAPKMPETKQTAPVQTASSSNEKPSSEKPSSPVAASKLDADIQLAAAAEAKPATKAAQRPTPPVLPPDSADPFAPIAKPAEVSAVAKADTRDTDTKEAAPVKQAPAVAQTKPAPEIALKTKDRPADPLLEPAQYRRRPKPKVQESLSSAIAKANADTKPVTKPATPAEAGVKVAAASEQPRAANTKVVTDTKIVPVVAVTSRPPEPPVSPEGVTVTTTTTSMNNQPPFTTTTQKPVTDGVVAPPPTQPAIQPIFAPPVIKPETIVVTGGTSTTTTESDTTTTTTTTTKLKQTTTTTIPPQGQRITEQAAKPE